MAECDAQVIAVSCSATHAFHKQNEPMIRVLAGLGVEGDAHLGVTVQHLSRVAKDPSQPNLRQVHLMHSEVHDELRGKGNAIAPGVLGENITTRGIDLLGLPQGTRLHIGAEAVIEVTGLRNPCVQLEQFRPGLIKALLDRDSAGHLVRKAGIMGVIKASGEIRAGDRIQIELPPAPYHRLDRV